MSAQRNSSDAEFNEKLPSPTFDEKNLKDHRGDIETADEPSNTEFAVLEDERDIATRIVTVADDETLNPWTLRVLVLGGGLSTFGGVLAEIYYFKPASLLHTFPSVVDILCFQQTVLVSTMFLAIIAFVLGKAMESVVPTWGFFRYLNPHPFNKKENAFIVIMASAAANSALGTEVLAVQRLYYEVTPNPGASIFLLFASQLAGYGIGGIFRSVLLYPSKMLYPGVLPLVSMFDALYKDAAGARKKLRLFWIAFTVIFFWEILPEWMFPLLTGFSIFCLANPRSADFTRVFGGSNGNEGLGLLSICFDWQYISGGKSFTELNIFSVVMVVFVAVYYKNIWNAKTFPFLSQTLFYANGTQYDQLLILNDKFEVDPTLLAEQGLPFYASTWVVQLLATNLGMAATFTHLLLWNRDDLRGAWSWMTPSALKQSWTSFNWRFWNDDGMRETPKDTDADIDPHYREMLKYPDAPNSWWGFFVSLLLATVSILFFGSLYAITGLQFIIQPFVQMIGGFIHPGKPVANMFFVLYSYNSVTQAQLLLKDLKIAQLEGTNIWSGQQPQQYNSQAIAWGGLRQLFAVNQRYQWVAWAYVVGLFVPVPFWVAYRFWPKLRTDYLYTPVICYYIGWLCVGINSSILSYFSIAYLSQWWLRTRYPRWFVKYNYVLAAALDGGTQVMVFILSFAVQGASGDAHLFPQWWGANQGGNYDRCLVIDS
ncbi:OPT oligopeptide transporter protein-domain-containing protein [Mycena sp. CBHHK59/15]|nr:OPT oligopeptide transporter protein-domain-containing protein [Mycena sp. CBHHK59/15]